MKKIIGISICTLLIGTIIPVGINATYIYDPLDGGWVEEQDGITILHVSGSYYDMGYQQGYLLKDKIEQNCRAVIDSADPEIYDYLLEHWNTISCYYTPDECIEEMQGLADGSGRSFDDVAVFNLGWQFLMDSGKGCIEMAAWGPATVDGKLYHMYSCDISSLALDPETGIYFHDNHVLIIREPDEGFASLVPVFAGFIGILGGMNENGISIAFEGSPCYDHSHLAIEVQFRERIVLDCASSVFEALDIMTSSTHGYINYVISDGKIPIAFIVEETVNNLYTGTWDNPVESTSPFWIIDHVVRRKNMFIHPLTAGTQRDHYDPRIYFILGMKKGVTPWFNPWRYYKTISEETEKIWGNIDLDNTMDMVRSIYRGETDIYLRLSHKLGLEKFPAYFQWVACPETGDIAISFAKGENYAQYEDVHHFNLFELLNSEPP